jgi:hypothetical protein
MYPLAGDECPALLHHDHVDSPARAGGIFDMIMR